MHVYIYTAYVYIIIYEYVCVCTFISKHIHNYNNTCLTWCICYLLISCILVVNVWLLMVK